MVLLSILLALPIILIDGIPLARDRRWPEFITMTITIGVAIFIAVGKLWNMPTLIELLEKWLRPISEGLLRPF
jgi:hypothetical protein